MFMEELTEDHYHEKVLPNLVRIFGTHREMRVNFSFGHHQWSQTAIEH